MTDFLQILYKKTVSLILGGHCMAANKPGKAEILAAFFDDGAYSPLYTEGVVSAAYGCANGQSVYVVFENGEPVGVQDIKKNIRVLEMAAETGAPVVTFYNSNENFYSIARICFRKIFF